MVTDALGWIVMVTLTLIGAASALAALVLEHDIIEPSTGSDDSALGTWTSASDALAAAALVLLVITLVLDTMVAVASLRRLDGSRGGRSVPLLVLGAVTLTTGLPLLVAIASLASILVDPTLTTALIATSLVAVLWLLVAPAMRFAQLGYGILVLTHGEVQPQTTETAPVTPTPASFAATAGGPGMPGGPRS